MGERGGSRIVSPQRDNLSTRTPPPSLQPCPRCREPGGDASGRPAIRRVPGGKEMVLLDFSMTPLGKGESVSPYVARCLEVVAASGLDYRLHAMGTTVEGELDQVLDVVRRCFRALEPDCDRVSCSVKIDYRKGPAGRLDSKVQKVQALAARRLSTDKGA